MQHSIWEGQKHTHLNIMCGNVTDPEQKGKKHPNFVKEIACCKICIPYWMDYITLRTDQYVYHCLHYTVKIKFIIDLFVRFIYSFILTTHYHVKYYPRNTGTEEGIHAWFSSSQETMLPQPHIGAD